MTDLLIILALVLANAVFAGAEIAVVALRRTRIQELAEKGSHGARAVLSLRKEPERFLATVQVGISVVGATAAAFGGARLAERLVPALATIGWIGKHAEAVALAAIVVLVSYLSIVLGELVPKSLALRSAERYALLVGKPLLALSLLARPVVWFLSKSANLVLKPFGDTTTFTETRHSADELQQLVEEAKKAGTIHPDAGDIASRALDLPELTVSEVMVPRQDVIMIPRHVSQQDLRSIVAKHAHSRLPVYDSHAENITGYVNVKDLLARALQQKPIIVDDVLRPPYFVPENQRAVALLQDMRARHTPFAIVVDEQGGVSGIVTLEDLIEELVGDIFSEHVEHKPELIKRQPDGSALVSGMVPIRELNRALGVELPDAQGYSTIAGLCLSLAGRVPSTGETLTLENGITLTIVDASPRRVRMVSLHLPGREAETPPGASS